MCRNLVLIWKLHTYHTLSHGGMPPFICTFDIYAFVRRMLIILFMSLLHFVAMCVSIQVYLVCFPSLTSRKLKSSVHCKMFAFSETKCGNNLRTIYILLFWYKCSFFFQINIVHIFWEVPFTEWDLWIKSNRIATIFFFIYYPYAPLKCLLFFPQRCIHWEYFVSYPIGKAANCTG